MYLFHLGGSSSTFYSTTGKGKKRQEDTQKTYNERINQNRQRKNKANSKRTNGGNKISNFKNNKFGENIASSELPASKCAYFFITAAALMLSTNISTFTYLTNSFNFLF